MTSNRRPARRMSPEKWAKVRAEVQAARQRREDERQRRLQPVPAFTPAPRLSLLPGGLHWSAPAQVPQVGQVVQLLGAGAATVTGYCHAEGFLGLVVEPAGRPKRRQQPALPRAACVFGSQLAQAA